MSVVDDRGRIFGRVNLLDAGILVVLVLLIPLAYAAYLLFRTPQPRLLKVEPQTISQGPNTRLLIWGENLRPFMRVSLNTTQALNFLISSTKGAEADLPELPPGTYDVVLYDYAQEVSRLPKAVTINPATPTPNLDVEVAGAFVGLEPQSAELVIVGLRLPQEDGTAEVLVVEPPRPAVMRVRVGNTMMSVPVKGQLEVPATLRVSCYTISNPDGTLRCMVPVKPPADLMPDTYLTFRAHGRWFAFQVSDVHLDAQPAVADTRVRFLVGGDLVPKVRAGDTDTGVPGYAPANKPRIVTILRQRPAGSAIASALAADEATFLDARLRIPLQATARGWMYRGQPFKSGARLKFETTHYQIEGEILDFRIVEPQETGR